MKSISFLKFIAICFALLITFLIVLHFIEVLTAEKSTKYTSDFSYEKFLHIQKGTPRSEVIKILGEPFPRNPLIPCDYYSRPKDNLWSQINLGSWIGDAVCYDSSGNVSGISDSKF